ncbi:MAG: S8 family serine peptidase [Acidobacteria bacterium]|nr:S8 family serine peptidase [Acidobacteriota bacterium]MDW7984756.1 S8 family serine peptidase [Acidobacteriota bacterium]
MAGRPKKHRKGFRSVAPRYWFLAIVLAGSGLQADPPPAGRQLSVVGLRSAMPAERTVLHSYLRELTRLPMEADLRRLQAQGQARGFRWFDSRVLVRILPVADQKGEVVQALTQIPGVQVNNAYPTAIEALVPYDRVEALASIPGIRQVTHPRWFRPMVVSEGLAVVGAVPWQQLARVLGTTRPTRVGIVDIGFKGYRDLAGTELPPTNRIHTRNFRRDRDFESTEHGTGVAEIVVDFTTDVELYLAAISTSGELAQAIDWLRQQGVQVINGSIGTNVRAGNGCCSPEYDELERAWRSGTVPFFAAGNEALSHWYAPTFVDPDGDGWLNFQSSGIATPGPLPEGSEFNCFRAERGRDLALTLLWYDWPTTTRDYGLYIFDTAFSQGIAVADEPQTGSQEPVEYIELQALIPRDGTYCAAIRRNRGAGDVPIELFIDSDLCGGRTPCFTYVVPDFSVIGPADGPNVIAVGGTVWNTDVVAPYSSRGPTLDGRLKPDITAPTHVNTRTYGDQGFVFAGTSAAAPHVAGAVALIHQKAFSAFSGTTIYEVLKPRSRDLGPPGPDPTYGLGRLFMLPPR